MDNNIFDTYADFYGNVKIRPYDYYFINFINKTKKLESKLVDIGGGSATFARAVNDTCMDIDVTVIDPSKKLLNEINDERIKKNMENCQTKYF